VHPRAVAKADAKPVAPIAPGALIRLRDVERDAHRSAASLVFELRIVDA
jgi:hypothetical protein